ncbi:MAG: toll/interleukin-1 receptor domain-containing protein, partial [Planctomycetes bacterium]|nr:toll/interleukin-1 receptor domain-containing protein [Planctomycetota bacterium]
MNEYNYDVFISYSRANSGWAKQFAEDLREALKNILRMDVSVFIDTSELHGGDTWFGKIMSCVENCGAFVAVYSPEYFDSKMCIEEFDTICTRQVGSDYNLIFPILHKTCVLKPRYSKIQYHDFTNLDYESLEFDQIIQQVAQNLIPAIFKYRTNKKNEPIQEESSSFAVVENEVLKGPAKITAKKIDKALEKEDVKKVLGLLKELKSIIGEKHLAYVRRSDKCVQIVLNGKIS